MSIETRTRDLNVDIELTLQYMKRAQESMNISSVDKEVLNDVQEQLKKAHQAILRAKYSRKQLVNTIIMFDEHSRIKAHAHNQQTKAI